MTASNFLVALSRRLKCSKSQDLAKARFFHGLHFHRVINDFMIQYGPMVCTLFRTQVTCFETLETRATAGN